MNSRFPAAVLRRRRFLAIAAAATAVAATPARSGSPKPAPLPEELESGDLLWPKKPGVFVPYNFSGESSAAADEASWRRERDVAIAEMQKHLTMDNVSAVNALRNMSYATFRNHYLEGRTPGQTVPYSFGELAAVGHVAIVLRGEDGIPHVVEAMPPNGVIKVTYDGWLANGGDNVVWQGRIAGRSEEDRGKFAMAAEKHLGTKYDFWNFNLADASGFYCSKLVWLAAMESLSLPLDGDPNPIRSFWLSPKQLLNANTIDIVLDQGDYGFD